MDPWSKVDYSRLIREASMAMEKLPEVNPPSGRVPGQGLLAAPILKRRRRQNREEIAKKGSAPRVFGARGKYRPKGARGVDQGVQAPHGAPWGAPPGRLGPWWSPSGRTLVILEGSFALFFLYIFPEFIRHFK